MNEEPLVDEENELERDDEPLVFAAQQLSARERYGMRFLFLLFFVMFIVAIVSHSLKKLIPFNPALVLLIIPPPIALLITFYLPLPKRWHEAWFFKDRLVLICDNTEQTLQYIDPTLIVGLGGINLDGGELLVWKRTKVKTRDAVYEIQLEPATNADCFEELTKRCELAIGISYNDDIRLPDLIGKSESHKLRAEVLQIVVQEFRKQLIEIAIGTVVWGVLTAGLIILAVNAYAFAATSSTSQDSIAKVVIAAIVGIAATLSSAYFAWKKLKMYRTFEHLRQATSSHV
jgi:hypothetical protein